MDYQFEKRWNDAVKRLSDQFGQPLDHTAILFMIGLQELGKDFQTFKKDQKVDIIHIGICSVLIPYGYYDFMGRDEEGWPHFQRNEMLPPLEPKEQELLIRRAILRYFDGEE